MASEPTAPGLPHAFDRLADWQAARRRAGRMLVALDFDGTLSAIAGTPGEAKLLPEARPALRRLAERPDTDVAIISGRALPDVRARVGIERLIYAGNHGLEIEGAGITRRQPGAEALRPRLAACADQLRSDLRDFPGVLVEDKGLTLSIHYRRVTDPHAVEALRERVYQRCADPALRVNRGRKILEVRPAVDWDKGRALLFLLDALHAAPPLLVPCLFIGDDVSDEDAFRAIRPTGDGILVAISPDHDTAATTYLRSPSEVAELLVALAAARPDAGVVTGTETENGH